jgi:hypothetical protein
MAITPQVRVSQVDTVTISEAEVAVESSQVDVLAVAIWPAEFIRSSQVDIMALTEAALDIEVSQADIMVVARGRVQDPYLRAWGFWLDNHWFYVLRLPTGITLVYDLTTEQWHIWGSGTGQSWRPTHGTNWLGSGALMGTYGSNVVCGDDGNGALYFLNPLSPTDDSAIDGAADPQTFLRQITGQVAARDRGYVRCYGVRLMGSIGENDPTLTEVTLYVSDDEGHTYDDMGAVTVDDGDYDARVDWVSGLGSFTAPGRLFRIEDEGALARIDWLDMMDGKDG